MAGFSGLAHRYLRWPNAASSAVGSYRVECTEYVLEGGHLGNPYPANLMMLTYLGT